MITRYHIGGLRNAPPGNGRAEELDEGAGTFTSWNDDGSQSLQRALTPEESAVLAAQVEATTAATNAGTLKTKAKQALATNAAYLAQPAIPASPNLATLTAAVRVIRQQVDALTRQVNGLIRLELSSLDDVSDS